jgi:hypothetical protein
MTPNAEKKIDALLEEALSNKWKAAGAAGLAGMVGAGLDAYFNGGRNIKEFIKPLTAWGLGGVIGGMLQPDDDKKNKPAIK